MSVLLDWIKKHWALVAGALLAVVAALGRAVTLGRVGKQVQRQHKRVDELQYEGARADERAARRAEAARVDEQRAAEATERLGKLKQRIGRTPMLMIVVAIVLVLSFGSFVMAETPITQKYQEALALISELTAQRDEAVELAETFKQLYENEKSRREEADTDLSAAREREKELYGIIQAQWDAITKLSRGSGFGVTVGVIWNPRNPLEPMMQVGVLRSW